MMVEIVIDTEYQEIISKGNTQLIMHAKNTDTTMWYVFIGENSAKYFEK